MARPKANIPCPRCGGTHTQQRGKQVECLDCKAAGNIHFFYPTNGSQPNKIEYGKEDIHVIYASTDLLSQAQLIERFSLDMDVWEVDRFTIKMPQPGYRKDHQADITWEDGRITKGHVKDSGKMLVVQFYSYELHLKRREHVAETKAIIDGLLADLKKQAPHYPIIHYRKNAQEICYELDFPDCHLGQLTWDEESGKNSDIHITRETVNLALDQLLTRAKLFHISQILIPTGNDFFNVNGVAEETAHGTRQQEDTREEKTFRYGVQLMRDMIAKCLQIAPVHVMIVKGNHDEQRIFYLGEVLQGYFHNSKHVTIENTARKRKYHEWGVNLIGFTHGYYEPVAKLPTIMAIENRANGAWNRTRYAEWHLGDKHHLKELEFKTDEGNGMTMRYLRSLSKTSTWTFDKGFVGALEAATAFVWDHKDGMVGHFNAAPSLREN